MVHVSKSDKSTRSCGNYAITVNPHFNVPSYPIPLPEDVSHRLMIRGGQKYTKLDLKIAYQQLTLDEENQMFVTFIEVVDKYTENKPVHSLITKM